MASRSPTLLASCTCAASDVLDSTYANASIPTALAKCVYVDLGDAEMTSMTLPRHGATITYVATDTTLVRRHSSSTRLSAGDGNSVWNRCGRWILRCSVAAAGAATVASAARADAAFARHPPVG